MPSYAFGNSFAVWPKAKIAACKKALVMLRPLLRRTWSPKPIYTRWLYEGVIIPMLTYGSAL
jgi:hypothetical protein